jgi:hypothetical protein
MNAKNDVRQRPGLLIFFLVVYRGNIALDGVLFLEGDS